MNEAYPRGVELTGSAIIENDAKQILVAKSPKWNDKWVLPGGHIEVGETILAACVREGEEETGLQLTGVTVFHFGELIGSPDFHRPAHFVYFNAHCTVAGGDVKLDQTELTEHQWLSPEEALQLDLAESYKEMIEAFITYKAKHL